MTHPEHRPQRGGYCEYPGITPAGNPDWWTRDTRPPAVRAGEPPAAWHQALAQAEPAEPLQQPITPAEPVDEPTREPAEVGMVRHWITQRTAATAPAPKPDEPRRWWHYLTARRR